MCVCVCVCVCLFVPASLRLLCKKQRTLPPLTLSVTQRNSNPSFDNVTSGDVTSSYNVNYVGCCDVISCYNDATSSEFQLYIKRVGSGYVTSSYNTKLVGILKKS